MKRFFANIGMNFVNTIKKDTPLVIYSIVIAIIAWFVISVTIYPTTPKTISNVPITIDLSGTSAQRNNLSVVSQNVEDVTVQIVGERSQIGNLKADEISARAVIDNVTTSGEYELAISIESVNGVSFEVSSVTPSKIKVGFDEMITQEIEVTADAPNVTIADGFYRDDLVCTPSTVNISGPRMQIEQITRCVVSTDAIMNLSSSYSVKTNTITLYNDSNVMDADGLTIDTSDFQIDIPVYMKREIPLDYTIKNAPSYFNTNSLNFNLSTETITVASPNNEVEKMETLHLGYIDLREVDIDSVFSFNVALKAGYKNLSGITTVTAALDPTALKKKTFSNVNDFSFINVPADYTIQSLTRNISVVLIGPEADIDKITAMDIVVQVDFSNINIQSESFSVPISILIPKYENVWAYMPSDNTPEVFVEATTKATDTTAASKNIMVSPDDKESSIDDSHS